MTVVLHKIVGPTGTGPYQLDVSIDGLRSTFEASVSVDGTGGGLDTGLFFLLPERGLAERGSSGQYHAELLLLLIDAHQGTAVKLPFVFGTDRRFPSGSTYEPKRWWHRTAFWRRGPEAITLGRSARPDGH